MSIVRTIKDKLKRIGCSRVIFDAPLRLGDFSKSHIGYDVNLCKEEISRKYLFSQEGEGLNFLDVGARDGKLTYLLGITENLNYDEGLYQRNLKVFQSKYKYFGMDLVPSDNKAILVGDICHEDYLTNHEKYRAFFDVIYSNNVFEHLQKPWFAASNLFHMLKTGGICITIVPFSQRYHESPLDYFRYTHVGIKSLFEGLGPFETLESGYDLYGRRNDWQGDGTANDIVPVDRFGSWRETWYTVLIFRKTKVF